MAKDIYFKDTGDFVVASNGDLSYTETDEQQILQQSTLRLATEKGDFPVYPQLGASLQKLVGRPNTKETADYGANLIEAELRRYNFIHYIQIDSWPTNPDVIQFLVNIGYGNDRFISITLNQLLS